MAEVQRSNPGVITPGGASHVIGDEYGSDFRFLLMLRLMSEGAISLDDAEDVLRYTQEYDNPEYVIGMLVGAKDVAPLKVSDALKGTEWQIDPDRIEEVGIPFSKRMEEAGGYFHDAAGLMRGYLSWTTEGVAPYIARTSVFDNEDALGLDAYISRDRSIPDDASPKELIDEIERLNEGGYLSDSTYKRLLSLTRKIGFSPPQTEKAIRELRDVYASMPAKDEEEQEKRDDTLSAVSANDDDVVWRSEEELDDRGMPRPEIGVEGVEEAASEADYYGESGSFAADLAATGLFNVDDSIELASRARAAFYGDGSIQDRSTGQAYSDDEWTAIKLGAMKGADPFFAAKKAEYVASKQIAPSIEELLNSGRFNVREVTDSTGKGTGEYREVESMGGMGHIPIEEIRIPSLVPTNPWETSTFDFKVGDGRAQWMSMTSLQRQLRTRMMLSNGLITDAQYDAMGNTGSVNLVAMSIWEGVIGFSSQMQVDPLGALREIGEEKRILEAQAPRGGSGRIAPRYSVPASLRTIPNYKTLATETKGIFSSRVGRDLEDWELAALGDELKEKYENRNNQMIAAHKEWWNDSIAGGTVDVDFSEVEEPAEGLLFDIEEKYANELDRQERVEDRANNRRVLMDSITTGQRMI